MSLNFDSCEKLFSEFVIVKIKKKTAEMFLKIIIMYIVSGKCSKKVTA